METLPKIVAHLLETTGPNYRDGHGNNLLYLAIEEDSLELVPTLLLANISPYDQNIQGETPMHLAAKVGWDPNYKQRLSIYGETPEVTKYLDLVKILLDYGAYRPIQDQDGWTPLHVAAYYGHEKRIRLLLDSGADQSITDNRGRIPEEIAVYASNRSVRNTDLYRVIYRAIFQTDKEVGK